MKRLAGLLTGIFLALVLAVPAAAETGGGQTLVPYGLAGTWTMTEGEIEGWHYTAEEAGIDAQMIILAPGPGELSLNYWYEDKNGNSEAVTDTALTVVQGSLFDGCENSAWYAAAKPAGAGEGEEYDVTLTGTDRLVLMHFFQSGGNPAVSVQWYRRSGPAWAELPGDSPSAGGEADPRPADPGALEYGSAEAIELRGLREQIRQSGAAAGVIYLGRAEGTEAASLIWGDSDPGFSFLRKVQDTEYVESEGSFVFCVIPAEEKASVAVDEWSKDASNDYNGAAGKVFYRSDSGKPVIVKGIADAGLPNLVVSVVNDSGSMVTWNPELDYTGMVKTPAEGTILDLTKYDASAPALYEIKGSWIATGWPDESGTLWESSVEILDGGGIRYACGHPGEMYETYYAGIWEYQEETGMLYFNLHLTENLGGGEKETYLEGSVSVTRVPGTTEQLQFRSAGGATFLPERPGDVVTYFRSVG